MTTTPVKTPTPGLTAIPLLFGGPEECRGFGAVDLDSSGLLLVGLLWFCLLYMHAACLFSDVFCFLVVVWFPYGHLHFLQTGAAWLCWVPGYHPLHFQVKNRDIFGRLMIWNMNLRVIYTVYSII